MDNTFLFEGTEISTRTLKQLLNRATAFGSCCFLDNLSYSSSLHQQEFLLAVGEVCSFTLNHAGELPTLDAFIQANSGRWIFGHIAYDLHKTLHNISSSKADPIGFPPLHFFVPEVCFKKAETGIEMIVQGDRHSKNYWIDFFAQAEKDETKKSQINLTPKLTKDQYINTIENLRKHILRGDCYEINFCHEFFAEDVDIHPVNIYESLVSTSPNPFACYYKHQHAHLMCASPERYLTRRGQRLISQPIKGTALRLPDDPIADAAAATALRNSRKETSENVMVVDLVRNDLSRVCAKGSVQVDELFGIYSYPQVHQMISTISGVQQPGTLFSEVLQATFPMGSMTGAPKLRVMELIEQYEPSCRGLFSGSVGYFAPNGDFDFNVVIRSIFYNQQSRYLNYQVGSGITWYSDPVQEYEECLWKAGAIRSVLG